MSFVTTTLLIRARIVAMVVGFCLVIMFFFVPETFWDRTPRPHKNRKTTLANISRIFSHPHNEEKADLSTGGDGSADMRRLALGNLTSATGSQRPTIAERRQQKHAHHVGFADQSQQPGDEEISKDELALHLGSHDAHRGRAPELPSATEHISAHSTQEVSEPGTLASHTLAAKIAPRGEGPQTPGLHNFNSPFYVTKEKSGSDYLSKEHEQLEKAPVTPASETTESGTVGTSDQETLPKRSHYTAYLRTQPPKTYVQTLKPWNGRLCHDNWLKVAFRPFILFTYPSILWSTLVYSLSIGWLIVLSESVTVIYENKDSYNFTPLQTGLVYVSPFVGGILGTAVAGKVSDIVVRYMSRRNGGVYEPEFRLVMAIPITIATVTGLMGYGWSAEEKDQWIVPTVFFGIISFGCALGSTTAITFAVDSYRQYAGEALVTLNFSKSKCNVSRSAQAGYTDWSSRHFSRPGLLALFQRLAKGRWSKDNICSHWRYSISLPSVEHTDVYLRQTSKNVDSEEQPDGEVVEVLKVAKMS